MIKRSLKKIDAIFDNYPSAIICLFVDFLLFKHECRKTPFKALFDSDTYWLYKNKGERMDANNCLCGTESRRIFHKDRYVFAANQLKKMNCSGGKVLIDSACGTGYGSKILSDALNTKVVGLDIDSMAVRYAINKYESKNTEFKIADLLDNTAIQHASVDCFVSFETIEHVPDPIKILSNISDWLKKDGVLIISTPNKWGLTPYHFYDYDYESFVNHLSKFFNIDGIFSQNSGSLDFPTNRNMHRRITSYNESDIDTAEILIAVCKKL